MLWKFIRIVSNLHYTLQTHKEPSPNARAPFPSPNRGLIAAILRIPHIHTDMHILSAGQTQRSSSKYPAPVTPSITKASIHYTKPIPY